MRAATVPPMTIQMALLVGDPVKNLETSELKEFVALTPIMMSTTPPTSRAIVNSLFIRFLKEFVNYGEVQPCPVTLTCARK
jgi:hypothetical protein